MKLIRRRDYNTKKRIGFEGMYLEDSEFKENTHIDCNIDNVNGSIMIKVVNGSKSYSHKVTRNITRSGKIVPAICIKNRTIEKFIDTYNELEIIIFKGIILLAAKNKSKNIIISKALIAHNKSLKENVKVVVSSLISLGIITDTNIFKEIGEFDFSNENIISNKINRIPKKILDNLKKSFKFNLTDKSKCSRDCVSIASNTFILSCIIDNSREYLDGEGDDDEEDLLKLFILGNYFKIYKCFLSYQSYILDKEYLYGLYLDYNVSVGAKFNWYRYVNIINRTCYEEKVLLRLHFNKRIEYLNVLIEIRFVQLGYLFLKIRKLINTLSPPYSSKTCLKCLM